MSKNTLPYLNLFILLSSFNTCYNAIHFGHIYSRYIAKFEKNLVEVQTER